MSIRKMIQKHGGPAAFRRALLERGVEVPMQTVKTWSAKGAEHREPPAHYIEALRVVLER